MLETTFTTSKFTLSSAVLFVDVLASRAASRSISWVNIDNFNPKHIGFVSNISPESVKAPGVQASPLPLSCLNILSYVCKVFKDDGCTYRNRVNYSFRQNVIAVIAETVDLSAKLFKFSLSRLGAFGLQRAFKSKVPSFDFPIALFTEEKIITGNSRSSDTKIDASCFPRTLKIWRFRFNYYMQKVCSIFLTKIAAANFPILTMFLEFRQMESHLLSSINGYKRGFAFCEFNSGASGIVSYWAMFGIRFANFCFCFFLKSKGRFKTFGGFHSSRAYKLTGQIRFCPFTFIRKFVEFNAVFNSFVPANVYYSMEKFLYIAQKVRSKAFFCSSVIWSLILSVKVAIAGY